MIKLDEIAAAFHKYAHSQQCEAVAYIGVRADGSWVMLPMRNLARSRTRLLLDNTESESAIRTLAEAGCKRLLRAHAGPKHVSPSRADEKGLGSFERKLVDHAILQRFGMKPPILDLIQSQTTGRYGVYLIYEDGYREASLEDDWMIN